MMLNRALAWTAAVYAAIVYALTFAAVTIEWMVKKIGIQATIAMVRRG